MSKFNIKNMDQVKQKFINGVVDLVDWSYQIAIVARRFASNQIGGCRKIGCAPGSPCPQCKDAHALLDMCDSKMPDDEVDLTGGTK